VIIPGPSPCPAPAGTDHLPLTISHPTGSESWDDAKHGDDALLAGAIRRRRAKAGIPETARHREKWRLALDMLDEVREDWELPDLPVVADAGYGDATGFREA
jgi:hypothetical protein